MEHRVAVIGAGSWGTALASLISRNAPTTLWARTPDQVAVIKRTGRNARYLPGISLPKALMITSSLSEALDGSDIVLLAVPSHGVRQVLEQARVHLGRDASVFSLVKGIEGRTFMTTSQIIAEVLPGVAAGVITGPNLAAEIAKGHPAACVVAS